MLTDKTLYTIIIACKGILLYKSDSLLGVWDGKVYPYRMLFEIYGGLLTDRQRDVMDLYYNYDLSLPK